MVGYVTKHANFAMLHGKALGDGKAGITATVVYDDDFKGKDLSLDFQTRAQTRCHRALFSKQGMIIESRPRRAGFADSHISPQGNEPDEEVRRYTTACSG